MTRPGPECERTQGISRGDARDPSHLRLHLHSCAGCQEAVEVIRHIARLSRQSLEADPSDSVREAVLARLHRPDGRPGAWLRLAPAAAALLLVVLSLLYLGEGAEGPAPAGPSIVVELEHPVNDRLPFVVRGPERIERGALSLEPRYALETVPAHAVVLDRF